MENLRGIALMVAAMACFLVVDVSIKLVADDIPTSEIIFLIGSGGVVFFGGWLRLQNQRLFMADFFSRVIIIRNLAEMVSTIGIITAVILVPLSTVSSIMQAAPMLVTIGAALFFRETIGWRRWSAITVGFIGVLIIIRPGGDNFQPAVLVALFAICGQAARDLSTRAAPASISSVRIGFYGVASLTVLGVAMMAFGTPPVMPSTDNLPYLIVVVVLGSIGYHFLNMAMRTGDLSAVVSFRYSRVLFGILAGILVFSERPDTWTYVGATLILTTGLYSIMRERKLRRSA